MNIDHLVIVATDLDAGAAAVEKSLGVAPGPGGRHPLMGTHNRLLSLGESAYLEVIAIDPDAAPPGRARWFGLDDFDGPPMLAHWVLRVGDLTAALGEAPIGMGEVIGFTRDDLEWSMAVPRDGVLPGEGLIPALLQWNGATAAGRLPDSGCCLKRLVLCHPEIDGIARDWPALADVAGVDMEAGREPRLEAVIVTPMGLRRLSGIFAPD